VDKMVNNKARSEAGDINFVFSWKIKEVRNNYYSGVGILCYALKQLNQSIPTLFNVKSDLDIDRSRIYQKYGEGRVW
jgi:hypothetical protein